MSKSLWSVFIIGVIGIGSLMILMIYGLDSMTTGPTGNRIRLARKLHDAFSMKSVGVHVRTRRGEPVMQIIYRTEVDTRYDGSLQYAEIEEVAAYAGEHYEGRDRETIATIHVIRTEERHRGCWTGEDTLEATHPNPAYVDPSAPGSRGRDGARRR